MTAAPPRRWPLVVILVLGVGLAAAPAVFQMFSRAPAGGTMIDDFTPYMTAEKLDAFRGYLTEIGAARDETVDAVEPATDDADFAATYPQVATFTDQWEGIDADMSDMIDTIDANRGRFDGVAALPPFALFPWFFVLPGVLIAGVAGWSLVRARHGRRPLTAALVVLGVGLLLAPAVFQMFSRAPGGQAMIADFEPLMTHERVTTIQGYFLTIGGGEGQLRTAAVPAAQEADPRAEFPAVTQLSEDWPTIVSELSGMVGAMADNLDNYAGIAALPPFGLFPWFFVIPGVAVIALALVACARPAAADPTPSPVPQEDP